MGLSSKQVSSRDIDWNKTLLQDQNLELPKPLPMKKQQHQQQQQSPQLEVVNCPRCDSSNTKFCYYNNYNKSQPRHFCRACKRHWTKGGTLRNVPVGGVKKNKRVKNSTSPISISTSPKTTISTTTKTTINTPTTSNANMKNQTSPQKQNQKNISSSIYDQSLIHPPSFLPHENLMSTKDSSEGNNEEFGIGNGMFLSSSMPFTQNQSLLFPFSNSSSLKSSNNGYNYGEEFKVMEESTINSVMPSTSGSGNVTQPWEIPAATSTGMDMSNYWSWEDIDSLVSTDLNVPWDDSDIKP